MLLLLHPLVQFAEASISAMNLACAYIKKYLQEFKKSHNAQNHQMDEVTVAFHCSRLLYSGYFQR